MDEETFRKKMAEHLGLPPDANDAAILKAVDEQRFRRKMAAALGLPANSSDKTILAAADARAEAASKRRDVRLQAADRRAIDAAVAASADPRADVREREILDSLGLPIARVPDPVRLVRGKDPATWSKQERDDAMLWNLGPAFRRGLKPPPGGAAWYQPSPNDVSYYDEASGEWLPKDNYQARG